MSVISARSMDSPKPDNSEEVALNLKVKQLEEQLELSARAGVELVHKVKALETASQGWKDKEQDLLEKIEELELEVDSLRDGDPPEQVEAEMHRMSVHRRSSVDPSVFSSQLGLAEEWEEERRDLERRNSALQADAKRLTREKAALVRAVEELKSKQEAQEQAQEVGSPTSLERKMARRPLPDAAEEELRKKLESMTLSSEEGVREIDRLKARVARAMLEKDELRQQLSSLQTECDENRILAETEMKRCSELEAKVAELSASMYDDGKQQGVGSTTSQGSTELPEGDSLAGELADMGVPLPPGLEAQMARQLQMQALYDELEHLRSSLFLLRETAMGNAQALEAKVQNLKQERRRSLEKVEQLQQEKLQEQRLGEQKMVDLNRLEEMTKRLVQEKDELHQEVLALQAKLQNSNAELGDLQRRLEDSIAQREELQSRSESEKQHCERVFQDERKKLQEEHQLQLKALMEQSHRHLADCLSTLRPVFEMLKSKVPEAVRAELDDNFPIALSSADEEKVAAAAAAAANAAARAANDEGTTAAATLASGALADSLALLRQWGGRASGLAGALQPLLTELREELLTMMVPRAVSVAVSPSTCGSQDLFELTNIVFSVLGSLQEEVAQVHQKAADEGQYFRESMANMNLSLEARYEALRGALEGRSQVEAQFEAPWEEVLESVRKQTLERTELKGEVRRLQQDRRKSEDQGEVRLLRTLAAMRRVDREFSSTAAVS